MTQSQEAVAAILADAKIPPASPCTSCEFIRRAGECAAGFLADADGWRESARVFANPSDNTCSLDSLVAPSLRTAEQLSRQVTQAVDLMQQWYDRCPGYDFYAQRCGVLATLSVPRAKHAVIWLRRGTGLLPELDSKE